MRTLLRWTSIVLFSLLSIFMIWFGVLYATVNEPLWFHAAAVPDHAQEAVRPLYFALMNLIGGSSFSFGLLALFVTLMALRKSIAGAGAILALAFAICFVIAAVTAEELAQSTGAPTSWHIMGVLLLLTVLAMVADIAAGRLHRRSFA